VIVSDLYFFPYSCFGHTGHDNDWIEAKVAMIKEAGASGGVSYRVTAPAQTGVSGQRHQSITIMACRLGGRPPCGG
jgi:hypothetical protein